MANTVNYIDHEPLATALSTYVDVMSKHPFHRDADGQIDLSLDNPGETHLRIAADEQLDGAIAIIVAEAVRYAVHDTLRRNKAMRKDGR